MIETCKAVSVSCVVVCKDNDKVNRCGVVVVGSKIIHRVWIILLVWIILWIRCGWLGSEKTLKRALPSAKPPYL